MAQYGGIKHPPNIRPRFQLHVDAPPAEVVTRLLEAGDRTHIDFRGNHVIHNGPETERHFWSPQLVMDVEEAAEDVNRSVIRCLFGPQPSVWTGFAAFYALSIFVAVVGGCWGAAQATLDLSPTGFWFCGVGLVAFGLSYVVAWQGQRLGREEMHQLRAGVDRRLAEMTVEDGMPG